MEPPVTMSVFSLGGARRPDSPLVIMGESCGCPGLCALDILRPIFLNAPDEPMIGEEEPPFIFGDGTF